MDKDVRRVICVHSSSPRKLPQHPVLVYYFNTLRQSSLCTLAMTSSCSTVHHIDLMAASSAVTYVCQGNFHECRLHHYANLVHNCGDSHACYRLPQGFQPKVAQGHPGVLEQSASAAVPTLLDSLQHYSLAIPRVKNCAAHCLNQVPVASQSLPNRPSLSTQTSA
jgi:hypothetical protein